MDPIEANRMRLSVVMLGEKIRRDVQEAERAKIKDASETNGYLIAIGALVGVTACCEALMEGADLLSGIKSYERQTGKLAYMMELLESGMSPDDVKEIAERLRD